MGAITGKNVIFDSKKVISSVTSGDNITLPDLLDLSDDTENQGVIYFTESPGEPKIIHNGKDYTGYHKPSGGIPQTDLATEASEKLDNGDAVYAQLYGQKVTSWPLQDQNLSDERFPSEKLVKTSLNAKAPLASPVLTGVPEAPTANSDTNTTQIATTAFVQAAIAAKIGNVDAMTYKGTIDGGSTAGYGALTPAADAGDTYRVAVTGKIDGVAVEAGDMLICTTDNTPAATSSTYTTVKDSWNFIQKNEDGVVSGPASSVDGRIALFDGATGKVIKDGQKVISDFVQQISIDGSTQVKTDGVVDLPAYPTKQSLGLENVGNFKAVSTQANQGLTTDEQQDAVDNLGLGNIVWSNSSTFIQQTEKGAVNGVAPLNASAMINPSYIPLAVKDDTGVVGNNGLMSKTDKANLDAVIAQLQWR